MEPKTCLSFLFKGVSFNSKMTPPNNSPKDNPFFAIFCVVNPEARNNWKSFSSQDYFDQAGVQTSRAYTPENERNSPKINGWKMCFLLK